MRCGIMSDALRKRADARSVIVAVYGRGARVTYCARDDARHSIWQSPSVWFLAILSSETAVWRGISAAGCLVLSRFITVSLSLSTIRRVKIDKWIAAHKIIFDVSGFEGTGNVGSERSRVILGKTNHPRLDWCFRASWLQRNRSIDQTIISRRAQNRWSERERGQSVE